MGLRRYGRVCLDTTACIYYLESGLATPRGRVIEPLVIAAETGATDLVASALTVTELLSKPLARGDIVMVARARRFLTRVCRVVDVDFKLAERAAHLRSAYGLRTSDAVICATGWAERADAVVGNDAAWKRVSEINYVHIDDLLA